MKAILGKTTISFSFILLTLFFDWVPTLLKPRVFVEELNFSYFSPILDYLLYADNDILFQ